MRTRQMVSPAWVVAVGMLGLAAAMGIGRFAFTPLMPLMQEHAVSGARRLAGRP